MSNHGGGMAANPGINYESRDLGARGIIVFLVVLAISGVFIELLVWGMLRFYNRMTVENNVPTAGTSQLYGQPYATPVTGDPALRFPKPALQVDDVADMNKLKAENEEILNSYSWVDKNNGVVRVPIQTAIDQVAQKGLPVRQQQNQAVAAFGDGNGSIPGEGGGAGSLVNH